MNTLFAQLSALFAQGHRQPLADLHDDSDFAPPDPARPAAVLIAVTDRPDPGVLMIHRPAEMRAHPGQAAFPGGKIDPGEDALAAALREAHEELGLRPADVSVIGATDLYRTGTNYAITPVLATVPADLPLTPNPAEVAQWFEPPLAHLLDPTNHVTKSGMFRGAKRHYLEIDWQGHRIWGVTAAIIANLSRRIAWNGPTDG